MALHSDLVFRLMTKTEVQNFEIASDAFQTFKVTPQTISPLPIHDFPWPHRQRRVIA
jgi:hypothetical protein